MPSPRSLSASRRRNNNPYNTNENTKTHGHFWPRRSMNGHSEDHSNFSLRSMLSPLAPPTKMEQAAEPDPSSLSSVHPPAGDYADKNFYEQFHRHTISDSTNASGSNDSSPTTTVSTVDDSSATEPSPGSSPESPPPATFAATMLRPRTSSDDSNGPFFELQKQPPPRKGRNLKGLAVNTSRHNGRAASTTSLPINPGPNNPGPAEPVISSIASPAFVKPPSPPKRKPSNLGLTLLTPAMSKQGPQEIRLAIPPTPAFGRPGTLRHFQSSPSLPLMPGLDSQTGVRSQNFRPFALETILSPIEKPKQSPLEEEEEQNFDIPLSREEKPEAYPEGPICVYDPYVDLYLEPTAEQCRQYDVVMNVASEVRNPLAGHGDSAPEEPEVRIDGGGGIQYAPRRPQLTVQKQEESSCASDPSPTTPKATPLNSAFPAGAIPETKDPEYIHIPWEHNSDIVPDLLRLCKVIDEKVQQSKRVLVHCQCGVSRSASLVVAYGLYKDPTMSVQEAYDAVKNRSKWIGPNMNLIMQLQEYRTSLMRGGLLSGNRGFTPITPSSALSEWRGPFSAHPLDPNAPMSAGPMTVPSQAASTADMSTVTPGPSSAPSGLKWPVSDVVPPVPTVRARAVSAVRRASAYVDPSGHIVPVLKVVEPAGRETEPKVAHLAPPQLAQDESSSDMATPTEPLASPRSEEFAMTALQPSQAVDPADMFGLMSPSSSSEFPHSPLDRPALLASLGMGSVRQDDAPRRAVSLRTRSTPQTGATSLAPGSERKLRGKISSPSLREQKQLQSLQARIEAALPHHHSSSPTRSAFGGVDEALMSPRATEFTKNPFALALSIPEQQAAQENGPGSADSDPRSPAHAGVSPITRNILDVL